jgi:hypothetical protein
LKLIKSVTSPNQLVLWRKKGSDDFGKQNIVMWIIIIYKCNLAFNRSKLVQSITGEVMNVLILNAVPLIIVEGNVPYGTICGFIIYKSQKPIINYMRFKSKRG